MGVRRISYSSWGPPSNVVDSPQSFELTRPIVRGRSAVISRADVPTALSAHAESSHAQIRRWGTVRSDLVRGGTLARRAMYSNQTGLVKTSCHRADWR